MIRLKIITNRKLCRKSLDETLEKVFEIYNSKCVKNKELDELENNIKRKVDIVSYLENFQIESLVLREKDISEKEYEKLYLSIKKLALEYNIPLFSHSHWKSKAFKEDGLIHLPMNIFEKISKDCNNRDNFFRNYREIGVSVHSVDEAIYAEKMGATYIIFGHIFETECKKGIKSRGCNLLRDVCKSVCIPVYAIGGINKKNAQMAIDNGAHGVCIMSGIMKL